MTFKHQNDIDSKLNDLKLHSWTLLKHCKLQAILYKEIFENGGLCKILSIKVLNNYTNKIKIDRSHLGKAKASKRVFWQRPTILWDWWVSSERLHPRIAFCCWHAFPVTITEPNNSWAWAHPTGQINMKIYDFLVPDNEFIEFLK